MSVTVREVALKAKVSTATVSRVINRDQRISQETSQRVNQAIQELGYTVNHMARGLKTSRSFSVGLICPEFVNDFYMGVAKGVEQALQPSQITLMICNSHESPQEEAARIDLLLDKCVDGIIIIPASDEGAHFERLHADNVPVVLVDRVVKDFAADAVLVDNSNGTYRAIEQAIGEGARRFAFIGGDQRLTSAKERFEGYRRALQDYQIEADPSIERFGDFHVETGYSLMKELLAHADPPPVVFISNYFMHVGATRCLIEQRAGLRSLPSIISFDYMELSFALGYCQMFIRQPVLELGMKAAELLLQRIREGNTAPARVVRLRTELVMRPKAAEDES
jgi:LacI family transcriptional regulator